MSIAFSLSSPSSTLHSSHASMSSSTADTDLHSFTLPAASPGVSFYSLLTWKILIPSFSPFKIFRTNDHFPKLSLTLAAELGLPSL